MPEHEVTAPPDAADGAGAPAPPGRPSRWSVITRLVGSRSVRWGFVVCTVGLGGYAVAREWTQVRAALASLGIPAVAGALVSVLVALLATMQVWRLLLASLGSPLPVRTAARIMFIGQLGKYLPGSIWPVLAQMELGSAYRVPRSRSASASVLTMLLSLLTGLLTALVALPFVAGSTPYLWALLGTPFLLVLMHPRVLNSVLNRLLRLARRPALQVALTGRAMAGALAWAFASWICYGLQIWLLAVRLGAPDGKAALLAAGGFALAWSVGFLVVLAPAGAGVRDLMLIATLGPILSVADATAIALVSRVLLTVADLLTAAVAAGFTRRSHQAAAQQAAGTAPPGE
jgi:uncharacterized membrane protein YbhN (UPF0104 family)